MNKNPAVAREGWPYYLFTYLIEIVISIDHNFTISGYSKYITFLMDT